MDDNLWRVYKGKDCLGTFVVNIESERLILGCRSFRILEGSRHFLTLENVFTTRTVQIELIKPDKTLDYTYIFGILGDHTGSGWEREMR